MYSMTTRSLWKSTISTNNLEAMVGTTEALAATHVARHVETLVEHVEGAQVVLPEIHNATTVRNMAILQKTAIKNNVMI